MEEGLLGPRMFCCYKCNCQVSRHDDILSKDFQSINGRAYLFSHAMNVFLGPRRDRNLMTGLHTVCDVRCGDCHAVLGWKCEKAFEESQKYKEGKFILEKFKIILTNTFF